MFLSKRSNGIYYLFYTNSNNKRACISTQTKLKSEALQFLKQFDNKVLNKSSAEFTKINLKDYLFHFLKFSESIHSSNTTKTFRTSFNYFLKYFGNIDLSQINKHLMLKYFDNRLRASSIYQVRKDFINLSSAFTRAVEEGYLIENPCKGIKRFKIPEKQPLFYSKEDIKQLLEVITNEDIKDLVIFALNTGMRQTELITLEWSQINLDKKLVTLDNRNNLTKSKRIRSIPLNSTTISILDRRKVDQQKYVFTIDGKRITQDSISNRFNRYIKKTNLNQSLNFHSLRHTFASWLVQSGVSIYHVSKLLGHSNIKTTEIYAHLRNDDLRKATDLISL